MRAELSEVSGRLSCFCPLCHDRPTSVQYRWYNHNTSSGRWSLMLSDSRESMVPEKIGTYSCRAVWENGRSLLSKSCEFCFLAVDVDQLIMSTAHLEMCQIKFSVTASHRFQRHICNVEVKVGLIFPLQLISYSLS